MYLVLPVSRDIKLLNAVTNTDGLTIVGETDKMK